MAKRTPPCEVYPAWTTSRYFSFIRSALRRAHTRWPPKLQAKAKWTKVVPTIGPDGKQVKFKTGRNAGKPKTHKETWCSMCDKWFKTSYVEMDHTVPCGSLRKLTDLPGFVERLLASVDEYRPLCKECHKKITLAERASK